MSDFVCTVIMKEVSPVNPSAELTRVLTVIIFVLHKTFAGLATSFFVAVAFARRHAGTPRSPVSIRTI